jgi:hypothetical protein
MLQSATSLSIEIEKKFVADFGGFCGRKDKTP